MLTNYLKENTSRYHTEAEIKFNSKKIFDQAFSINDYKNLLIAHYRLLASSENNLNNFLDQKLCEKLRYTKGKKLLNLKKDLHDFNDFIIPVESQIEINSKEEAIGVLYVIQGSSLGGNVIAKQLKRNPIFCNVNFHYFREEGEHIGSNWKNFVEVLNFNFTENQYNDILKGAIKAYQKLLGI